MSHALLPPVELIAAGAVGTIPDSELVRLVGRVSFGVSEPELEEARSLGWYGYLDRQLDPLMIDDSELDAKLAPMRGLWAKPHEMVFMSEEDVKNDLMNATVMRAVLSRRQLLERMVELWSDFFNNAVVDIGMSFHKNWQDRTAIRPHALGRFPDLLKAVVHTPSMLRFFNNDVNRKLGPGTGPNENFARELMDLHTLGVPGAFSQADVVNVARCFTGWTFYPNMISGSTQVFGELTHTFRYVWQDHDDGPKLVLGFWLPASGGKGDGDRVLDLLAYHPLTARNIARKLLVHFWGYEPSTMMIDRVAAVYRATQGDIGSMLRNVLDPRLTPGSGPKLKRPMHLLASLLRATRARIDRPQSLQAPLVASGHLPFHCVNPEGYADQAEVWQGALLPRWNMGAALLAGEWPGLEADIETMLENPVSASEAVERISRAMFGGLMQEPVRLQLLSHLGSGALDETRLAEAVGLAAASPQFQWY